MPGRKPFVGGNWKSNGTRSSVEELVNVLNSEDKRFDCDVVVAPTFLHIDRVLSKIRPDFKVACQNVTHHTNKDGAFTGEIHVKTVKDFGLEWVITGHSERRALCKETEKEVATKTKYAVDEGLCVILCIGESLSEREANRTLEVCIQQLQPVVDALNPGDWDNVVIAYEPVWAIGTGVVATPEQAQQAHCDIRNWLRETVSSEVADNVRILYGGSVTGKNSSDLIALEDVDGFLVGGASLKPDFLTIIANASGAN